MTDEDPADVWRGLVVGVVLGTVIWLSLGLLFLL